MEYKKLGWRVRTVWECALKGKSRLPFEILMEIIEDWLINGQDYFEICGKNT